MVGVPLVILALFLFSAGAAKASMRPKAQKPKQRAPKPTPRPPIVDKVVPVPAKTIKRAEPPPWPADPPHNLPPFPGPGWEPDSPPGAGVAVRAAQLLPTLWSRGEGAHAVEFIKGRWIGFKASRMGSKRGVTAWRMKKAVTITVPEQPETRTVLVKSVTNPEAPPRIVTVRKKPKEPAPAPVKPAPRPVVKDAPKPHPQAKKKERRIVSPKPEPKPAPVIPPEEKEAMAEALPVLRYGAGMNKGQEHLAPFVRTAQEKLGGLDVDGKFGWGTYARVKAYQSTHTHKGEKLAVDGVIGPNTWGALMGAA